MIKRRPDGAPLRTVHIISDVTDQHEANEYNKMLMQELTHRSKNQLTVVSAMARQTGRNAENLEDFQTTFSQRLESLGKSIDLLVDQNWSPAPLRPLVESQLRTFTEEGSDRIRFDGPDVKVDASLAQALGMSLHELATNATKYGALSNATGKVDVTWDLKPDDDGHKQLLFRWRESGGPLVLAPQRRGFGSVVLETMMTSAISTPARYELLPSGVVWEFETPLGISYDKSKDAVQQAS